MKILITILLGSSVLFLNGQNVSIDKPASFDAYFQEDEAVALNKIQLGIMFQLRALKHQYRNSKKFDSPYLERLNSLNTDPENYISKIDEFPELYSADQLIELYREKREKLNFYMYHSNESSDVSVKELPTFGGFPYQRNLDVRFISSFNKGKERQEKSFKFYTNIDSVKLLYSYKYPSQIDTIRVKVGNEKSSNPYGITLIPYDDYGIEANIPIDKNIKILDVVGIDKDGNALLANVLDHLYIYDDIGQGIRNLNKKFQILVELSKAIDNKDIKTLKALKSRLSELKAEYEYASLSKESLVNEKNLFQIFGYAEEVIMYVQSEERIISETVIIQSQEKIHPHYDFYTDENLKYNVPREFFYNRSKNKKLNNKAYDDIDFLGSNYFEVEHDDNKCERLVVNEKKDIVPFGECIGKLHLLANGGIHIEKTDKYGLDTVWIKVFDQFGNLKLDSSNGIAMNAYLRNSNFVVISENEQSKFLLGDYKLTDLYDNHHVYSPHRALVFKGEKCSIIDDFGKEILPFQYTNCEMIGQNSLLVNKDDQQLIISETNEILHEENEYKLLLFPETERALSLSVPYLNLVAYIDNDLYGIKDINGTIVFPARATEIAQVGYNRIAVTLENGFTGVIDEKGNEIIPFQYEAINPYYGNYAILINENGTKFTFYDYDGKVKVIHFAEESYEIWGVFDRPTLILDDKIHIRYNGVIFDRAD